MPDRIRLVPDKAAAKTKKRLKKLLRHLHEGGSVKYKSITINGRTPGCVFTLEPDDAPTHIAVKAGPFHDQITPKWRIVKHRDEDFKPLARVKSTSWRMGPHMVEVGLKSANGGEWVPYMDVSSWADGSTCVDLDAAITGHVAQELAFVVKKAKRLNQVRESND